jgi:hypothetical protein
LDQGSTTGVVAAGKGAQQKRDESGLRYGHPGLVGQPDQLGD